METVFLSVFCHHIPIYKIFSFSNTFLTNCIFAIMLDPGYIFLSADNLSVSSFFSHFMVLPFSSQLTVFSASAFFPKRIYTLKPFSPEIDLPCLQKQKSSYIKK